MSDRTKFIGGSDSSVVLGVNPYRTKLGLWLDKIQPRQDDAMPPGRASVLRRGKRLEPYVVDMAREEYGFNVVAQNARYIDPEVPFLAAEIDFEIEPSDDSSSWENGEIKTVHPFKAKEWGDEMSDELPLMYIAQAQHGMMVTGRPRTHVVALIGDDLRRYVVERDNALIDVIRAKEIEFWTKYVEPKVRPPVDYDHPATGDELRRMYPGTDGTIIAAEAIDEHWRAVYEDAKRLEAEYKAVGEATRSRMLARIGNGAAIRFRDGKEFARSVRKRKAYTIEVPAGNVTTLRLQNTKED